MHGMQKVTYRLASMDRTLDRDVGEKVWARGTEGEADTMCNAAESGFLRSCDRAVRCASCSICPTLVRNFGLSPCRPREH